jgi:hypothetical protein
MRGVGKLIERPLQDRLRAVDPDESFPFGTENETITTCSQAADAIDTLRAEVARLRHVLRVQGGLLVGQNVERRAKIVGQRLLDAASGEADQ